MVDNGDTCKSFNWIDFHTLAEELAQRGDEASLRTAVSRSYYAVFNVARCVVACHDPEYSLHRHQESHKAVWDKLGMLKQRQAKSAARKGRGLQRERQQADYVEDAEGWVRRVKDAVQHAGAALRGLVELL
ncbi:MAG TPA: hypothetical protein ENJ18_14145 [Nannocystis exedens]|nr:hypothetical protein [Nannocystis exedens]